MTDKKPQFSILLLLVSLGSVGGVFFSPALPAIAKYFGVTSNTAQLTMSAFLFSYAVGQLPYGPLSNKFGRKNAVYIGALISSFSCLLCFFSPYLGGIWVLIFGRLLMGLGSAVGLKMAFTIVSDAYTGRKIARVNSHLILAFAIIPGIAAAIGGIATTKTGWESTFLFLFLYTIIVMALVSRLPETLKERDPNALKFKYLVKSYREAFRNPPLLLASFIVGIGTSYVYIFATKGPFFGIRYLGLTAGQYGLGYLITLSGMLIGSLISGWLPDSFSLIKSILLGVITAFLGACAMLISWQFPLTHFLQLFIPPFFVFMGMAISYGNCITFGLTEALNKANASAIISFINIGISFLAVLGLGFIPAATPLMVATILFSLSLINIIVWFCLRRIVR